MSIGALQNEADLRRFVERLVQTPGVLPAQNLPFKNLKKGVESATFSASKVAGPITVAHGLGVEPTGIDVTPIIGTGETVVAPRVDPEYDETSFDVRLVASASLSVTIDFFWIAVA